MKTVLKNYFSIFAVIAFITLVGSTATAILRDFPYGRSIDGILQAAGTSNLATAIVAVALLSILPTIFTIRLK